MPHSIGAIGRALAFADEPRAISHQRGTIKVVNAVPMELWRHMAVEDRCDAAPRAVAPSDDGLVESDCRELIERHINTPLMCATGEIVVHGCFSCKDASEWR